MRQLVVLVGVPGAGKTSLAQKNADWAVVSKDLIRQSVFGCSYELKFEEPVDRIFSSMLIEVADSQADVVCVDDLNLLRKDRRELVELGRLTKREPVAVVLPFAPIDEIYQRAQDELARLASTVPTMQVATFPRERFDAMLRCYEAVQPDEGFVRIDRRDSLPYARSASVKPVRKTRKPRQEKQHPIPLFAA